MDRVARRGPLARAPGALKSQCRKTERGDLLRFFNIHSVAKHEKIEGNKNFYFRENSHNAEKLKGTLWDFPTSILSQNDKKIEGGPFGGKFFFRKKVSQCRKKLKGGTLWSRPVWYVTRENRKNLFGSVR